MFRWCSYDLDLRRIFLSSTSTTSFPFSWNINRFLSLFSKRSIFEESGKQTRSHVVFVSWTDETFRFGLLILPDRYFHEEKKKRIHFRANGQFLFFFFFFFCRLFQRYWLFLLFTPMKEGFQRILLRFAQLRNSFDEIFFQSWFFQKSNFYFIDFYISTSKQHESWKMRFDEERKKGEKK